MQNKLLKIFVLISILCFGQQSENESLAIEYYKNKDYNKAIKIFKKVYNQKKTTKIYNMYFNCLVQVQSYKDAEKLNKNYFKKNKNPNLLVDLATLYDLQGMDKKFEEELENALSAAIKNKRYLISLANKLYNDKYYSYALEAYNEIKKENPRASHFIKISNIYSHLGEVKLMYKELLDLVKLYPNYLQSCKNMIRRTISDDKNNENNIDLRKAIIKEIQRDDSLEIYKLLIWLFIQENRFDEALKYEIKIHEKIINNFLNIFELSDIAGSNFDFTTAKNALEYITKNTDNYSFEFELASWKVLNLLFVEIQSKKIKNKKDIEDLTNRYEKFFNNYSLSSGNLEAFLNYVNILTAYQVDESKAIKILNEAINSKQINDYEKAQCKIALAKILVSTDDIWESMLLYSQVEKDFKEDVVGQLAKFEKAKVSYYNGDFEWAQNKLNVLKYSTSKLIANNAMKLSLLISDNLNLDTTDNVLKTYAQAELLFEQKKYEQCLKKLSNIENNFPGHTLTDEVLYKKFEVFINLNEFDDAVNALETICTDHYFDILFDDALFYLGELYENVLKDPEKAKLKYEEILLKEPDSIYSTQARKRYRNLRSYNF